MSERFQKTVRERYAALAEAARRGEMKSCCSAAGFGCGGNYTPEDALGLPPELLQASLGCGNPVALAELQPGEVVLDLGCGAGLDVLLAARRVKPGGRVYGLDTTGEMLALAREYLRQSGLDNVEFIRGEMENIPLPDACLDVVISNCVINLASDKARVLAEAFRVLKPGGRLAVSDTVWRKEVPAWLREDAELWASCVAGALTEAAYRRLLAETGFVDVELDVLRGYGRADIPEGLLAKEMEDRLAPYMDALAGAFIRARKPGGRGDRSGGGQPPD